MLPKPAEKGRKYEIVTEPHLKIQVGRCERSEQAHLDFEVWSGVARKSGSFWVPFWGCFGASSGSFWPLLENFLYHWRFWAILDVLKRYLLYS